LEKDEDAASATSLMSISGKARSAGSPSPAQEGMINSMSDEPETDTDAYRPSEATRLRTLIADHREGLAICGISGAGGIGKSFLVDHVLSSIETAKAGWLALRIDAAQAQARGDFFALVDGQLARRSLAPPADPRVDYFPATRRVAAAHRALVARVEKELELRGAPEDVRHAAVAILKAAHFLNKAIPKTREYVDVAKLNLRPNAVGDRIDEAWDIIKTLKALRDSEWLPEVVRDRLGMNLASRLKRDLYGVAADAFVSDLSAALTDESSKNRFNGARRRIPDLDRLLLVIDDYEALEATLGDFLVGSLIPWLAEARFATMLIIAGRDDLEYTPNTGWSQHCKRYLTDPIRLRPFDEETAAKLMAAEGIPEGRQAAIYELTQGFPLLLSLAIEEAAEDGTSALFLKRFFDRTTRWMSDDEREWFTRTCYLDEVNEDTLRLLFPEEDVSAVQDWFEGEASIRDPSATTFRVRPLIREKVLSYIEVRSPKRHRELLSRAQAGKATSSS
jgi:hypothetical protein